MIDTITTVQALKSLSNVLTGKGDVLKEGLDFFSREKGRITSLNKRLVVRPRILLSKKLEYVEDSKIKSIVDTQLKIFTANYVQAFKMLVDLKGEKADLVMDKLNSRGGIIGDIVKGYESNCDSLDFLHNETGDFIPIKGFENSEDGERDIQKDNKVKMESSIKSMDDNIKYNQLFITTYEISITTELNGVKKLIKIPIIIYPMIVFVDMQSLVSSLVSDSEGAGFFDRIDAYKSGAISLADLIFANGLIKKYKDKRINNLSDVEDSMRGARYSNFLYSITNAIKGKKNTGYSDKYNIYVVEESEKLMLDNIAKGNILKNKYKEKLLQNILGFSLTLIDLQKERATILISDIDDYSVLSFKMMKKDKDTDVNDIFKNLLVNKSPF